MNLLQGALGMSALNENEKVHYPTNEGENKIYCYKILSRYTYNNTARVKVRFCIKIQ